MLASTTRMEIGLRFQHVSRASEQRHISSSGALETIREARDRGDAMTRVFEKAPHYQIAYAFFSDKRVTASPVSSLPIVRSKPQPFASRYETGERRLDVVEFLHQDNRGAIR
jgi:hypothetical protein